MYGFSKRHFWICRKMSVVVVVVYAFVTCAIDLFHNDECHYGTEDTSTSCIISCNDPCPACTFSAGHNSIEVSQVSTLVGIEYPLISQFIPCLMVVNNNEFSYSITSRAPPSMTIS
jgi:hypothetical protein